MRKGIIMTILAMTGLMAQIMGCSQSPTACPEMGIIANVEKPELRPQIDTLVNTTAPDFSWQTIDCRTLKPADDKSTSLSNFRDKLVLVVFTSVNCVDCEEQMPYIEAVYKEWSERLTVLNVYCFNAPNQVRSFVDKQGYTTFPALCDPKGRVATQYGIAREPVNVFIDAQGILKKYTISRFQSREEIESILKSL